MSIKNNTTIKNLRKNYYYSDNFNENLIINGMSSILNDYATEKQKNMLNF